MSRDWVGVQREPRRWNVGGGTGEGEDADQLLDADVRHDVGGEPDGSVDAGSNPGDSRADDAQDAEADPDGGPDRDAEAGLPPFEPEVTFVVVGDTQTDRGGESSYNTRVLPQLIDDMNAHDPEVGLFVGDLVG